MPSLPQPNPNPQGKGLVTVLQDLRSLQVGLIARKSPTDFLRDYCVSSLILEAKFRFKPVVDVDYFLYVKDTKLCLSLIAPHQWEQDQSGEFLARCALRPDMTWQMSPTDLDERSPALEIARNYIERFVLTLSKQDAIAENLPFYVAHRPYYQRMLGTALASSLRQSMPHNSNEVKALLKQGPDLLSATSYSPLQQIV